MKPTLKLLLEDLLDVLGECDQWDHHGYCQTHFVEPKNECVVIRIKKELSDEVSC